METPLSLQIPVFPWLYCTAASVAKPVCQFNFISYHSDPELPDPAKSFGLVILKAGVLFVLQGYGSGLKEEEETHMTHMNVNVTSSGQGTRTVVLQIPRVRPLFNISTTFIGLDASDSECRNRNCPGLDPSILRHSVI
jgi:hypothetical protein